MKKVFMFSCIAAIFFGCCSQKSAKQNFNLYGKNLTLTELDGKTVTFNGEERAATITFNKEEGKVNGNLGCNRFFGTFEINGNSLKFSQMGATKMMCINSMDIEDGFNAALNATDSYEIKDGALILKNGKKVLAVLK